MADRQLLEGLLQILTELKCSGDLATGEQDRGELEFHCLHPPAGRPAQPLPNFTTSRRWASTWPSASSRSASVNTVIAS